MSASIVQYFPWLKTIDLYITTACGWACPDCMSYEVRMEEGMQHMEEGLYHQVMDALSGIKSARIVGLGEPSEHPKIIPLLEYASERAEEVIVNTNGKFLHPLYRVSKAREFVKKLPKNLHIYFSADTYHEKNGSNLPLAWLLRHYAPQIKITYNVRVLDKKGEEVQKIAEKYKMGDEKIVQRVLKMGRGKDIEDARLFDLQKLLRYHMEKPTVGVLHNGRVISNNLTSCIPKSNRPRICELGDLHKQSLFEILDNYAKNYLVDDDMKDGLMFFMESSRDGIIRLIGKREELLRSMIDDMGPYPFTISNISSSTYSFNWSCDALKDKKREVIENTLDAIAQGLNRSDKPIINPDILISINGKLRHDIEFAPISQIEIKLSEMFNGSMLQDVQNKDKFLKLCVFLQSLDNSSTGFLGNSPEVWQGLLDRLDVPEGDKELYMSNSILPNISSPFNDSWGELDASGVGT